MKIKIRKSAIKKNRLSGFLRRSKTASGRKILARRRRKGRPLTSSR